MKKAKINNSDQSQNPTKLRVSQYLLNTLEPWIRCLRGASISLSFCTVREADRQRKSLNYRVCNFYARLFYASSGNYECLCLNNDSVASRDNKLVWLEGTYVGH